MKPVELSDAAPPMHEVKANVCVIGAGVAGLVAARRIASAGISVVLLESGGFEIDPRKQELNVVEDVNGTYTGAVGGRFRGLGGTSMQWGGRLLPLRRSDVEPRSYLNLSGWPIDFGALNRYDAEINRLFSVDASSYDEEILDGFSTRGSLPKNDTEIHIRLPKWVDFKRCNLGRLLRSAVEKSPNLSVWLNSTVCEFELSDRADQLNSITARNVEGKRLRVRAAEFIVAAGTIESTRLLLLLERASHGRAFARCGVLGRYFQDHLGCMAAKLVYNDLKNTNRALGYRFTNSTRRSLHFELGEAVQREQAVASGFAHVTMIPAENSSTELLKRFLRGLQVGKLAIRYQDAWSVSTSAGDLIRTAIWRYHQHLHFWPADLNHQLNIWIEQVPHWENRISLSEQNDAFGIPRARIEWKKTETEERTLRVCLSRFRDYWRRYHLDQLFDLDWVPAVTSPDIQLVTIANDLLHPSGSTRMGTNPAESVVDSDLRCHDLRNLTVASASVFPTSGSANPTYTILQLAFHVADAVIKRVDHSKNV